MDAHQLWYYVLYPILAILAVIGGLGLLGGIGYAQYNAIKPGGYTAFENLLIGQILVTIVVMLIKQEWKEKSIVDIFLMNPMMQALLFSLGAYTIYLVIQYVRGLPHATTTDYEPFDAGSVDIAGTLQQVQQSTTALRTALDTFTTATDDTCSVMKGIEQKFIDNATSPSGDGAPPSPAEAKELKAQLLPAATQKWAQKQQDWSDTHGQVPVLECFADGSLSDLAAANQELSDLLSSAPVARVTGQVKSMQTTILFAQKDMDDLTSQLQKATESFDTPTPEDAVATSNKLIAQSSDVQSIIQSILASVSTLKRNYTGLNTAANDPNTVTNLAGVNH